MLRISRYLKLAGILACMLLTQRAMAADLTIGEATEPASLDPHYVWSTTTTQLFYHYLGFLTRGDAQGKLQPSIASKWTATGPNEWTFELNKQAQFSNGAPVTADDVIASLHRAATLPTGSYKGLLSPVDKYVAVNDKTLKVTTKRPYPVLPFVLNQLVIVPKSIAEKATSQDFLKPEFNVSAGPYIFTQYIPGDRLILSANPHYFGPKPKWDHVTFRFISDSGARVAALLSGAVDVIDSVSPDDANEIKKRPNFVVNSVPSNRGVYMTFDLSRDVTPQATTLDGKPLPHNPFKDVRVRRALSLAINRDAIVQRIMAGQGAPMNQMGSAALPGYNASIPKVAYDPAQAKKLLADAGYPNGFGLTVSCWNGRIVNDARVCQGVAQMLERVGLKMKVDVQPYQTLVTKEICHCDARPSFFMSTWSSSYMGEISAGISNTMRSYDKSADKGNWNLGEYSNPALDQEIDKAEQTTDDKARLAMMSDAMKKGMEDVYILPLYLQGTALAARKGLNPQPMSNDFTVADYITPAQ
jgi:peptide/nickel transport system substrate-binding protein